MPVKTRFAPPHFFLPFLINGFVCTLRKKRQFQKNGLILQNSNSNPILGLIWHYGGGRAL